MRGLLSTVAALIVLWLVNSGHYTPLLLGLGAVSVLLVAFLAGRMAAVDGVWPDGPPLWRVPGYLVWLLGQIVAANLDVLRRIWRGPASLSPRLVELPLSMRSEWAQALYANSITLTPGTVTVDIGGGRLLVHALSEGAAAGLADGAMARRVQSLER
ncbi:MAG: cation transporter [Gammaproteobacteria bacterium]|nr:MAG: cation transporter [Gammaproteobacteria bacterium]